LAKGTANRYSFQDFTLLEADSEHSVYLIIMNVIY